MFYHAWFLSIYSIVCLSRAQYIPPEALVEPLKPTGIRISIPGELVVENSIFSTPKIFFSNNYLLL